MPNVVSSATLFIGQFCFVAGTPVVLADGSLKPIEQIQPGDLVLSKDESSGELAAKRVAQTFERQAPATLALTFSGGEVMETTAEHPFYAGHKGFVPAGLLAIGNSIVTRAGPSLAINGIEKRNAPQRAYNFTVEEFHSYFVGKSNLWTHNTQCKHIWSPGPSGDSVENAFGHWKKHKGEFPNLNNAVEYVNEAGDFLNQTPSTAMIKFRANGDKVVYDPPSGLFGVLDTAGQPKTYFKPDPAKHGYPTNIDYFNAQ